MPLSVTKRKQQERAKRMRERAKETPVKPVVMPLADTPFSNNENITTRSATRRKVESEADSTPNTRSRERRKLDYAISPTDKKLHLGTDTDATISSPSSATGGTDYAIVIIGKFA